MVEPHSGDAQCARPFLLAVLVVTVLVVSLVLLTWLRSSSSRSSHSPALTPVGLFVYILKGGVALFRSCVAQTRRMSQRRKLCCVAVVFVVCVAVFRARRYTEVAGDSTFVRYYLSHVRLWPDNPEAVLDAQRRSLAEEMEGYDYPAGRYNVTSTSLADLVPELGGQPIRSIVVTSWRSGSTFLGAILNSHPATFYHFEPLALFAVHQIRSKIFGDVAAKDLRALLTCNYSQLTDYLAQASQAKRLMYTSINIRLWEQCYRHPTLCWRPDFMTRFCRLFPFHSMKTVRLRLRYVETLLSDPSLNVRVIYLVRDPRGTFRSRNNGMAWCSRSPDCIRPDRLCLDLETDHEAAARFAVRYPHTFRAVRYEDLAVAPHTRARELLAFLGLSFHARVREYLDTHTQADRPGGALNTYHSSSSTPFSWQHQLAHEEVAAVQAVCSGAMQRWGYQPAHNDAHQRAFSPVGEFKLDRPFAQ